jgi:hypothetical protein
LGGGTIIGTGIAAAAVQARSALPTPASSPAPESAGRAPAAGRTIVDPALAATAHGALREPPANPAVPAARQPDVAAAAQIAAPARERPAPQAAAATPRLDVEQYDAPIAQNRTALAVTIGVVGMILIAAAAYFAARFMGLLR